jgi:hypothetical protein
MASYITFIPAPPNPKTKVWYVATATQDSYLGKIAWFGRWRCYSFFPNQGTIFEKTCLRDIADFCEEQTKAQRIRT